MESTNEPIQPRVIGWTVNGRTYNVTDQEIISQIPKGTTKESEEWLISKGYVVIKDLKDFEKHVESRYDE